MNATADKNRLPNPEALNACPISKNRINALFEAYGVELWQHMTQAERDQVKALWLTTPSGDTRRIDAVIALYQHRNQIGDYA